ncbi:MAG TPA: tetratricopeptide repeat protein [Chloroflexia bacterium]|nr:tetratricopeptide repeat protein [Chloroflexia bacterium]
MPDTLEKDVTAVNTTASGISLQTLSWLNSYCLAVIGTESLTTPNSLPASLRPRLSALQPDADGEYSEQIEDLQVSHANQEAGLTLDTLTRKYRCNILLGKTGSGKTYQLQDILHRRSRQTLARLEQSSLQAMDDLAKNPLVLPVYISLSEIKAASLQTSGKANPFQQILKSTLERTAGMSAPANLLAEVTPLVLLDNLELLEPSLAPIFLYKFNQWVSLEAPHAQVVLSCQHLNFSLYHPWFKTGQEWQIFALHGFDWNALKALLSGKLSSVLLSQIEASGLAGLFTHPALGKMLYPLAYNAGETQIVTLFQSILGAISENRPELITFLAQYSRLLHPDLLAQSKVAPDQAQATQLLVQASKQGLVEEHPALGWTRLVDPALDQLLGAWFYLQLDKQNLPAALSLCLSANESAGQNHKQAFLKLLYLLYEPGNRSGLISALLGQPPDEKRLNLLIETGKVDPAFIEVWREFLKGLLADTSSRFYGQQVLELSARLAQSFTGAEAAPKREHALLAEVALEQLLGQGRGEPQIHLSLGRVREQLGKTSAALESYRQAHQDNNLPVIESALGLSRLLSQSGNFEEAFGALSSLQERLQHFEAEINNQLSQVKRRQGAGSQALEYARKAVQLSNRPTYRHNLALALHEQGASAEAEQELLKLTGEHPDFAEGYYDLGRIQTERGDGNKAMANLRRAVELSSNTARYLSDLARTLLTRGRHEEAYTYMKAAVTQGADEPEQQTTLGLISLKLNKLDEARSAFQRTLELNGNKAAPSTLVYLAATEHAAGEYGAANSALLRALNNDPQNPHLHLLAGKVAEADNKPLVALSQYRQAVAYGEASPNLPEKVKLAGKLGLARALRLSNNLDEADQHVQAALQAQPGAPEVLYEAGQLALERKNYSQAATFLGQGVKVMPVGNPGQINLVTSENRENDWLALFEKDNHLNFELPFKYAQALRHTGRHEEAAHALNRQLNQAELFTPDKAEERKAAIHHELGLNLLALGKHKESLSFLEEASSKESTNAHYRLGLAKALLASGNRERALHELHQARELDPNVAEIYAQQAEAQLSAPSGQLDQTLLLSNLNLYLKALDNDANHPGYLYRAALLAYHLRHQNQTTELINKLLKLSPEMPEGHLLAACNLERSGSLEQARSEVEAALKSAEPLKSAACAVAIRLARKAGALDQVEQLLNTVDQKEALPKDLQAVFQAEQGWLAQARSQHQAAAQAYREAITLYKQFMETGATRQLEKLYFEDTVSNIDNPGSFEQNLIAAYKVEYARALRNTGQVEMALSQTEEAAKLNPRNARAYFLKAELLQERGTPRAALEALKRATELEPTPARCYELGLLHLQLEEPEAAIEALKQAGNSREISSQSIYHAHLGQAYQKAGNNHEARAAYTRGLQINPDDPELHQALARCYLNDGEKLAAVQPLQGAVVSEPHNPRYHFELANLYEELGWLQEAAAEYQQVTGLTPQEPKAWLKNGQTLTRIGQVAQGKAALEQAIQLDDNLSEAHYEMGMLHLNAFLKNQKQVDSLPPDLSGIFWPVNEENNRPVASAG